MTCIRLFISLELPLDKHTPHFIPDLLTHLEITFNMNVLIDTHLHRGIQSGRPLQ